MKTQKKLKRTVRRSRIITGLVVVAIVAIAAITVLSRQTANNKRAQSPSAEASGRKYVSVKVAGQDMPVDSRGQIRPLTQEEARRMAEGLKKMLNKSQDGLVPVTESDGSITVDLHDRFQNVAVARVNQDGTVTQSCIDDPRQAAAFFGIDPQLLGVEGGKTPAPARPNSKSEIK